MLNIITEDQDFQWTCLEFNKPAFKINIINNIDKVKWISASDYEAEWIRASFENLPIMRTSAQTCWYGDIARSVLLSLSAQIK